jgi:RNA polymerase sigma-70 factor (ECF subfamily)
VSLKQMIRNSDLFWKLTEPEHLRARAFCRKLMGNRDDGDDLYQDALVSAFTRFDTLRDTHAFRAWLYRIVVNAYKNRVRLPWWKRFRPLTDELIESRIGDNPVESRTAARKLEIAFRAVSPDDRALITLFEMEGWSISEIALMQNKSEGAVKMRLSRARQKMRETLVRYFSLSGAKPKTQTSKDEICVAAKPSTD